jgi:hypothetical protein
MGNEGAGLRAPIGDVELGRRRVTRMKCIWGHMTCAPSPQTVIVLVLIRIISFAYIH